MHESHLECAHCGTRHEVQRLQTVCTRCGGPLLTRYDLDAIRKRHRRTLFENGAASMWRFAALLPRVSPANNVSLGEGLTPLLSVPRAAAPLKLQHVWVKDEGSNPTGTFKARGLCLAVARALELGVRRVAVPTAGNAGVATACYAARAGLPAHVFVPDDVPARILESLRRYGAQVTPVRGLISDAGKACAEFVRSHPDAFDLSTFKEPYRVEGKKTMGLELAVDLGWKAPDVVVYPTGGGTGIVGVHKAFQELRALGWVDDQGPRFVMVQAEGCAPIVRAYQEGKETAEYWQGAQTSAPGIRVPQPFADRLLLRTVRESKGAAVTVTEPEIQAGVAALAQEGISACPEGGAAWAGLVRAARDGVVERSERVVVFNTGSGLVY